ncbi:hypothetical protein D3C77_686250 [compost metagenome]
MTIRSNRVSQVGCWQFAAENGVVDALDVVVQTRPLRKMLAQAAWLGKVYLKNFVFVVG